VADGQPCLREAPLRRRSHSFWAAVTERRSRRAVQVSLTWRVAMVRRAGMSAL
jgi:hypothetical protein